MSGIDHFPETTYNGPVHGELVVDGDGSSLTALTLYQSGETTEVTLGEKHRLYVTHIHIELETGGDYSLVADGAVAGEYVAHGALPANGQIDIDLSDAPFCCQAGVGLKFQGVVTNRNVCIIEGYVNTA